MTQPRSLRFPDAASILIAVALLTSALRGCDPTPTPGPTPTPTPTPTELHAIVIEESAQRTPAQAIVLGSTRVRTAFKSFQVEDKDATAASLQPYIDRAKSKGLPYLMIVNAQGQTWWEGPLPATVDDVLKVVVKGGRP